MSFVEGAVCDGDLLPGQGVEGVEEGAAVLLDREHELPAMLVDVLRGGLDGVERVGGHDLAVRVDLAQHLCRHRHFIGLRADFGLGGDHRGGGIRAGQGRERVRLIPLGVLGATDRLAIQPHPHQHRRVAAVPVAGVVVSPARPLSHRPMAASKASASVSVSTRQIVVFDACPRRAAHQHGRTDPPGPPPGDRPPSR
ncbi:MAG TPA: hypothetical protein VFO16_12355 [Pseudonocardiaceae bacterium]|nr:hypothetical protein [Pseudonocardiaceae bacterium]